MIDINSNNDIINRSDILIVTPANYHGLIESLRITLPEIKHLSLIEFQNQINTHLKRNPELYSRLLKNTAISLPDDLELCCIVNLLENEEN
jgi:hypothetical protein